MLDALRFLRDTAGHGLKEAVRSRGGMGEIRTLQARTPAGLKLAVQVGTDDALSQFPRQKGNLVIGEGRDTKLPLEDVAEQLEGDCKGRVVHLGTAVPSVYTVAN